jgi:hypothetical protein
VRELPIPHERSESGIGLYDQAVVEEFQRQREARRNAAVRR